jgi:hypothetical protein
VDCSPVVIFSLQVSALGVFAVRKHWFQFRIGSLALGFVHFENKSKASV